MNTDTISEKGNLRTEANIAFGRGYLGLGADQIFEDNAVEQLVRVLPAMVAIGKEVKVIHNYMDFCSINNLRKVAADKRLPEPVMKDLKEWLDILSIPLEGSVPKEAEWMHEQFCRSWVVLDAKDSINNIRPGIEDRYNQVVERVYGT